MAQSASPKSTMDADEIAKFSALADEWWKPNGKFRPLHQFNPVRLAYIRDQICRKFARNPHADQPLTGLRLLDIGCGGGLLSEPMARLGADVIGVDASDANIKTAASHARDQGLKIDYRATTAEALADTSEPFDIILNMEVVEHVAHPTDFIAACGAMVKPGGGMFLATLNRTTKAFALAIVGAEYVLRWLPRGTHQWGKFITPKELDEMVTAAGLVITRSTGVSFNPLLGQWYKTGDMSVNYMCLAEKPKN